MNGARGTHACHYRLKPKRTQYIALGDAALFRPFQRSLALVLSLNGKSSHTFSDEIIITVCAVYFILNIFLIQPKHHATRSQFK